MHIFAGIDVVGLIKTAGYLGLFLIIFAESGVLVGFFLPGDSLLFTAGFLASQGYGNLIVIAILCFGAAVLGDSFGYFFGKKLGPKIFAREDGLFFKKAYVDRMHVFYERHGSRALILARFIGIVRTLAPICAGVGAMPYRKFLVANVTGGFLWAVGLVGLGYALGSVIPGVDRYILPLVVIIIVASLIPAMVGFFVTRWKRA